jgi:hypothetical protein
VAARGTTGYDVSPIGDHLIEAAVNRRCFVGLLLAGGLTGCSSTRDGVVASAPAGESAALIVGPVTARRTEWQWAARRFRRTLIDALIQENAFMYVMDTPPHPLPTEAVLLKASVLDFDEGYDLVRFALGIGSGGSTGQVDVSLRDAAGETLLAFVVKTDPFESLLTPTASGAASTDIEPMIDAMAEGAAERIARWRRQSRIAALP